MWKFTKCYKVNLWASFSVFGGLHNGTEKRVRQELTMLAQKDKKCLESVWTDGGKVIFTYLWIVSPDWLLYDFPHV